MLVITADESDGPQSDATPAAARAIPNSPLPGIAGLGGGRIGALVHLAVGGRRHLEHDAVQPL